MVTAQDVARRAGVSTSTVSHVLNGTRVVSDDLRERVLRAFDELDYEPNAVARSLKIKRSNTIGLIISDISNVFFTAIARGVEDVAQESGYALILCNSDDDASKEAEYLRLLRARRVDGLVIAPAGDRHDALVRLVQSQFPLVLVDRDVPGLDASTVTIDNESAAFAAVNHLIGLGHRRIAMVASWPRFIPNQARVAGYRRALEEAGIPEDRGLFAPVAGRSEEARLAAAGLLDLDPRPTAFFASTNQMTMGTIAAIYDHGLNIPDDIALVGFDDVAWASVLHPRLTTVAQPTYELGRTAAQLLLTLIKDDPLAPSRRVILGARLIVRESAGEVAGRPTPGAATITAVG